ncbi:glycosyltransferase [Pseudorhodobacter turbinis]|uniref:Glycosyltransferase n=1 Tax=Pseudorhodobacter turbinis TaxID=2500533 RepID=A0A4P8EHP2_9RHOB|nr:glycosyltransferase [Pseudorhodobacter turbinis]QCO56095.1 glycosyltransferase [Pseudorhodobacter turbinis]
MTPTSLIIVSRHRACALIRALMGVAQMDHPAFEVIVVADPDGIRAAQTLGLPLKLAEYDQPNISAARNIGLGLAAAPVVAFLDDDAVPEPSWLSRLVAPFSDARVTAAGGFVLGRSGLAWQWQAAWVDGDGFDHPFDAGPSTSLHSGTASRAIKTQGTNCAFRREALLAIGGFDEGYRFYLDEADVNLRLAATGGLTAVVPDAVVHHGYAPSARRRADRVPTDLTEIGHSLALFTTRHGMPQTALPRHIAEQKARLIRHMIRGALEPRDITRLMDGLSRGIASGQSAVTKRIAAVGVAPPAFSPLPNTGPRPGRFLFGAAKDRTALQKTALRARKKGEVVTLILLSRGLSPHRHRFTENGVWEQSGGRFGRSFRNGKRFEWRNATARKLIESKRLALYRPL